MKYIAIIGYGVVGGGITAFLESNGAEVEKTVGEPVSVKYIVDLREFPESPYSDRVVHTIDPVLADGAVSLVCETMGGAHPAYEYTMAAFQAGKSVVTSNKEVVATFGDKLLAEAKKHGASQLELTVVDGNERALALYRKMGFDVVGRMPRGFVFRDGTTHDEIYMVKIIG